MWQSGYRLTMWSFEFWYKQEDPEWRKLQRGWRRGKGKEVGQWWESSNKLMRKTTDRGGEVRGREEGGEKVDACGLQMAGKQAGRKQLSWCCASISWLQPEKACRACGLTRTLQYTHHAHTQTDRSLSKCTDNESARENSRGGEGGNYRQKHILKTG